MLLLTISSINLPHLCIPPSVHSSNLLYSSCYDSIYTPLCPCKPSHHPIHRATYVVSPRPLCICLSANCTLRMHHAGAPSAERTERSGGWLLRTLHMGAPPGRWILSSTPERRRGERTLKTLHAGAPSAGRILRTLHVEAPSGSSGGRILKTLHARASEHAANTEGLQFRAKQL